ncbi:hypothetical protein uth001_37760 [Clostridium butyricum]
MFFSVYIYSKFIFNIRSEYLTYLDSYIGFELKNIIPFYSSYTTFVTILYKFHYLLLYLKLNKN